MDSSFVAYIDESGGHGFDFNNSGTSKYFIVSAIFVERENRENVLSSFAEVKKSYYPNSELKSSKIGGRYPIRRRILEDIKNIDFKIHCLIVDKKKIHLNTGLQYKESFYKFLYGLLYSNIYKTFNSIEIVADQLISNEFIDSFEKYIKENHVVDLFHQNTITFSKSNEVILLQLSDLIGGTINRFSSGKSDINVLELFKEKILNVKKWPAIDEPYAIDLDSSTDEFHEIISKLSLLRVNDYLDKNISTQDNTTCFKVIFLTYIKMIFEHNSQSRFIHTAEILDYIRNGSSEKINEQSLRQNIIDPLRSEG